MSASAPGARGAALLPRTHAPAIVSAREAKPAELDALLAIVPLPTSAAAFRHLPESARWRELDARGGAHSGSVRTTVLSHPRQTLAVLGYLASDASAFEHLTLAGRMLKEAAARNPETLGLAASGSGAAVRAALEALLAASLAHAFALPSFRAPARHERRIRRIVLPAGHSVDTRYAGVSAHMLATRFLARFVPPAIPWAHVDLSSATRSGGLAHVNTDVTGFGVRFALELILGQQVLGKLERGA